MGNAFLFPKTPSTYALSDIENLFWIPESLADEGVTTDLERLYRAAGSSSWIPAQYFKAEPESRSVLVYFHGNSCDLGDMSEEMKCVRDYSGRHVVHIEYPGYGICTVDNCQASAAKIDRWARAAANFLIALGIPPAAIVPFGRSIGTGPAASLALYLLNKYGIIGGLVLQSPYISIHALVADYAWQPAKLIFNNDWDIKSSLAEIAVKGPIPVLIIHGEADEVIPVRHGKELLEKYDAPPRLKEGVFPTLSQHNAYYVLEDLVYPIDRFLRFKGAEKKRPAFSLIIPPFAFRIPNAFLNNQSSSSVLTPPLNNKESIQTGVPVHRTNKGILTYLLCGCESPPSSSPHELATNIHTRQQQTTGMPPHLGDDSLPSEDQTAT